MGSRLRVVRGAAVEPGTKGLLLVTAACTLPANHKLGKNELQPPEFIALLSRRTERCVWGAAVVTVPQPCRGNLSSRTATSAEHVLRFVLPPGGPREPPHLLNPLKGMLLSPDIDGEALNGSSVGLGSQPVADLVQVHPLRHQQPTLETKLKQVRLGPSPISLPGLHPPQPRRPGAWAGFAFQT